MDKYFHSTVHCVCDYLSMLGLKLPYVSKRSPEYIKTQGSLSFFWSTSRYWGLCRTSGVHQGTAVFAALLEYMKSEGSLSYFWSTSRHWSLCRTSRLHQGTRDLLYFRSTSRHWGLWHTSGVHQGTGVFVVHLECLAVMFHACHICGVCFCGNWSLSRRWWGSCAEIRVHKVSYVDTFWLICNILVADWYEVANYGAPWLISESQNYGVFITGTPYN